MVNFSRYINYLMAPCTRLMGKLNFRLKLFLVSISVIIPLLLLTINLIAEYHSSYKVADDEAKGIAIGERLLHIVSQLQTHRAQVRDAATDQNASVTVKNIETDITKTIEQVDTQLNDAGFSSLDPHWKELRTQLSEWGKDKTAITDLVRHDKLIDQTDNFLHLTSEASGLVLDPEANSYFLIILTVQKIPDWVEYLAQIHNLGKILLTDGELTAYEKSLLTLRTKIMQVYTDEVMHTNESLIRFGATSPANLGPALSEAKKLTDFINSPRFDPTANASDLLTEYEAIANTATAAATKLQLESSMKLYTDLDSRRRIDKTKLIITSIVVFLTLCATSYLAFGFYFAFSKDMQVVNGSVTSVAAGNLTTVISMEGQDELANIGQTLENMNYRLSALVANVRSNASMVSNLGQNLSISINDLSFRTIQQSSSLEQTSYSVRELADTVKDNAENARQVSSMAKNVHEIAESSGETMKSAVSSMKDIQSSALKVQEIVNMIDRISFQTDILALNAAVEAAHAGEHGLGFAVVATEVRALAQRSADAARQIRRLIDDSVTKVENGVYQIDQANVTLNEIVEGIRNLATNINAISDASNEQSTSIALISEAILSMEGITQSNAQMAEDAKLVSQDLEQRAITLTSAVSSFKLRQGTADEAYELVKKAVSLYSVSGEHSLQRITDNTEKLFADRDMYVFAIDHDGYYTAFAGRQDKVGVNIGDVPGVDGPKLIEDAFAVPEMGGWIDYQIINPLTQQVDKKTSYMVKINDDLAIGCGVYKLV